MTSDSLTNTLLHKIPLNGYRPILSTWYNFFLVLIYDWICENRVKTLHQNSGHVLGKTVRITAHKYGYVVLRALSASCTRKRSHNMLVHAVKVTTDESNELSKAE